MLTKRSRSTSPSPPFHSRKMMRLGDSSSSPPVRASSSAIVAAEQGEKSVYVRVVRSCNRSKLEWYSFGLDNMSGEDDEEGERALRGFGDYVPFPTPLKGKKISHFSGCVAVGSSICCMGGLLSSGQYSSKVRYLDTNGDLSWKKAPSMLRARSNPLAVVINGEIYVMGGTKEEPWAEVFHPTSWTWSPISSPSPKPSDGGLFCVPCQDSSSILVGSSVDDFLYIYHAMNDSWVQLDHDSANSPFGVRPVLVGSTLTWYDNPKLHAYDTIQKWHCSGRIKGLKNMLSLGSIKYDDIKPVLLYLGDDLFCWICYEGTCTNLTMLHCLKFQLTIFPAEGSLSAVAKSCQSCLIKTPSLMLDAVVI